ncbi:MAG: biotin/lipoyl-containing protein [Planctomycetota bacterium]
MNIVAPMMGKIAKINVKVGDKVQQNQPVIIFEAMKIEMNISAPAAGTIKSIAVKEGQTIEPEMVLVEIE